MDLLTFFFWRVFFFLLVFNFENLRSRKEKQQNFYIFLKRFNMYVIMNSIIILWRTRFLGLSKNTGNGFLARDMIMKI